MTGEMWEPIESDDGLVFQKPEVEATVCRGLGLAAVVVLGELYEHVLSLPPSVLTNAVIEAFNNLEEPMSLLGDALTEWEESTF